MSYVVHPASKVVEARRMVEAGWSVYRTAQLLGVNYHTVRRWTDPEFDEENRRRARVKNAQGRPPGARKPSPEFLLARAQRLRDEGLSYKSIATLFRLDYGEKCTGEDVARWVKSGRWRPKPGRPAGERRAA